MINNEDQPIERRKFVRVYFSQHIKCDTILVPANEETMKLEEPLIFESTNISLGGISLLSENHIELGTLLFFSLEIDSVKYDVISKVVYCACAKEGFFIGLEFVLPNDNFIEHLKRLVTRLSFGGLYNK